ncbi:MAG: hypothetical protein ACK4Q5_21390, partial [Saprospiraceae bacterium]
NSGLFAQAVPLFSEKTVDVPTEMKPNAGLADMLRYRPVQFNPNALNAERVAVELFDGQKAVFQRTPNAHTNVFEGGWSGAATGTWHGNLIVTPIKTGYRADIFWEHHYFQVFPSGNGTYFLVETNRSNIPAEDCHDLRTNPGLKSKMEDSPEASGDDPVACNIRLLVAYTNAANNWSQSNGFGDALGLAQAAINVTNTTYANSQVNFRVELAHLVRVGYTESGSFATDVDRFQNPSDGNMDEIHALRDLYRTDLCVLITEGNADCGRAFGIGADADVELRQYYCGFRVAVGRRHLQRLDQLFALLIRLRCLIGAHWLGLRDDTDAARRCHRGQVGTIAPTGGLAIDAS